jgi:hypothetical protein
MINKHCYNFELRKYNKGLLDNFVDATYIITLEGSNRQKNIEYQLSKYIPTEKIYIAYNKGFKNCNKILPKQISAYDLIDANLNILDHSLKNNFNNILILEDDFIFNDNINNKNIINNIELFFEKNKSNTFYFNLGPTTILFYPNINIFNPIFKGIYCGTSHSIIFNKNIQIDILKKYESNKYFEKYLHWDTFIFSNYDNYFYKYPLCYQIFPITENQQYWFSDDKNSYLNIYLGKLIIFFNKILSLNKTPEPGYTILYNISFFINYSIFILIIFIIIYYLIFFIKYLNKSIKKSIKKKLYK